MRLVPPYIESLVPYEAGRTIDGIQRQYGLSSVAKLASNVNPLGSSPLAIEAIQKEMGRLHLYPNGGLELRRVLAKKFNLKPGNVIAGSGSDGILSNIKALPARTF